MDDLKIFIGAVLDSLEDKREEKYINGYCIAMEDILEFIEKAER